MVTFGNKRNKFYVVKINTNYQQHERTTNMTTPNRQYKDSLFTDYFHDKERIIEAYNAVAGTDFPMTANVEFKTLENV